MKFSANVGCANDLQTVRVEKVRQELLPGKEGTGRGLGESPVGGFAQEVE